MFIEMCAMYFEMCVIFMYEKQKGEHFNCGRLQTISE